MSFSAQPVVIDGKGHLLGRLASVVSKQVSRRALLQIATKVGGIGWTGRVLGHGVRAGSDVGGRKMAGARGCCTAKFAQLVAGGRATLGGIRRNVSLDITLT
jgi:hypothetical protein